MEKHIFKYQNRHNIHMANTLLLPPRRRLASGNVAVLVPKPNGNGKFSPLLEENSKVVRAHMVKLGSDSVARHSAEVLRIAAFAKLINPQADEGDRFSLDVSRQIDIHSIESESYLPNIQLTDADLRRFELQRLLKKLDSSNSDRMKKYVELLNDPSIDLTDLVIALYTRIADMMAFHSKETVEAAKTKMPGVFPVHGDWEEVVRAWAEPMLKLYCPIADWGGQTEAYRFMRDNAMYYTYPQQFMEVVQTVIRKVESMARTHGILMNALEDMSKRLNIKVLVAYDYKTLSKHHGEVDKDTVLVSIRPFKGAGGLLNKSMDKGIPVEKVHDWGAATIITENEELMYKIVSYLYEGGIRSACRDAGIYELFTHEPKDYVKNPKPITLYRSIHLDTVSYDPGIVPFELIVRTLGMHVWADEGGAAHENYKGCYVNGERYRLQQALQQITAAAA